jgi:lysozyme family protein
MQKNFVAGVTFTLKFEGGYEPPGRGDPGGATNMGITLATYRLDVNPHAGIPELRALSRSQAASIYNKHYWATINADALPGGVDVLAFDIAVNSGVGRARQFLAQTAKLPSAARVQTLHNLRMGWWKRLATWARFGRGWTTREVACRALALKLAGAGEV